MAALTANDQLRQRVAFALSEIFVVSTDEVNVSLGAHPRSLQFRGPFLEMFFDRGIMQPTQGDENQLLSSFTPHRSGTLNRELRIKIVFIRNVVNPSRLGL
jgi:hypothetical protein